MTDFNALTISVERIADARRDALVDSLKAHVKAELLKVVGPDYDPADLRNLAICVVKNDPWPASARAALVKRIVEELIAAVQAQSNP